jgi:hypothetical protein
LSREENMMVPASPNQTDVFHHLLDTRLELFNVRRDHEWKIFFGVLTLIGAVDIALVTNSHLLTDRSVVWTWRGMLILLLAASVWYEIGVQRRNRIDRIVMDALYHRLCDAVELPRRDVIRLAIDTESDQLFEPKPKALWHLTYMWAFYCQTIILSIACVISWRLPDSSW